MAGQFRGFYRPLYTQIPDTLFDDLLPDLTGAELKVLLYIFRHTLGYKKDDDAISLTQICSGILKKDGERQDRGTGLHRETASKAIRSLEEKNAIEAERRSSAKYGNETTVYRIKFVDTLDGKTDAPESDNPTGPSRISSKNLVGKSDPQETIQETTKQETKGSRLPAKLSHDLAAKLGQPAAWPRLKEKLEEKGVTAKAVREAMHALGPGEGEAEFWRLLG